MRTLRSIATVNNGFVPRSSEGEAEFMDAHKVEIFPNVYADVVNPFTGQPEMYDRNPYYGYNPGEDEDAEFHEEVDQIDESEEPTHVVSFQKGSRVGARSHHMEYVTASDEEDAIKKAKTAYPSHKQDGYKVSHVHTFGEELEESVTRKHFQMVADTLKHVDDPQKRHELATHHAEIFAKANPRFDKQRFFKAANVQTWNNRTDEEEQLDELSKKTLSSYVGAAAEDLEGVSHDAGVARQAGFKRGAARYAAKARQRAKGIDLAAKKLAKEEQLDEISKTTALNYIRQAPQQVMDRTLGSRKAVNRVIGTERAISKIKKDKRFALVPASGNYKLGVKLKYPHAKAEYSNEETINEVTPPGMEHDAKAMKPTFKKEYGKNWKSALYATLWKRHNNEETELQDGVYEIVGEDYKHKKGKSFPGVRNAITHINIKGGKPETGDDEASLGQARELYGKIRLRYRGPKAGKRDTVKKNAWGAAIYTR